MRIKIYGSKGSQAFYDEERRAFGSNTSCVLVETRGTNIVLDCGTGLAGLQFDFQDRPETEFHILLSHLHLDHIIGLGTFSPLLAEKSRTTIYTFSRDDRPIAEQVFGIFASPYWPIDVSKVHTADVIGFSDYSSFFIGDNIKITPYPSRHSDMTTGFKIQSDYTLVYLLDYEWKEEQEEDLIKYCKEADVIIFDCSYLPKDLESKKGWGHSSYENGIRLAEKSHCKKMIFSHFSFEYTDEDINDVKNNSKGNENYLVAYDGMELIIND